MKKKYETIKAETIETSENDALRCSLLSLADHTTDENVQELSDVYAFSWLQNINQ